MRRTGTATGLALLALSLFAADAAAQRDYHRDHPSLTLEVYGGGADYGDFLEQAALPGFALNAPVVFGSAVQRELTAETSFSLGGSVGVWPWEKTGARLAFTWSPTDLEFQDDTGIDSDLFDRDDVGDLDAFVLSLEVLRFLLDAEESRFAPYVNAGIAAAWWNLDLEGDPDDADGTFVTAADDTEFRWGGVGGLGLQIALGETWATRLEVSTFGLGNPFDGDDAFRVVAPEWFTFDEPSAVRLTRFTVGLTYHLRRDGLLLNR